MALRNTLRTGLNANYPDLYPPTPDYDVHFNYAGMTVHFQLNGITIPSTNVPKSARFFSLRFTNPAFAGSALQFDPDGVARVSILNKAAELSFAIRGIVKITGQSQVVLIAHSMGGIVARAYLEDLASITRCYDYNMNVPDYRPLTCIPGGKPFGNDVASLITIDSPHGGADLAAVNLPLPGCLAPSSTNKIEMISGSDLLNALNFVPTTNQLPPASNLPSAVEVESVVSYISDEAFSCTINGSPGTCRWDDVINSIYQAVRLNIPQSKLTNMLVDTGNPFLSTDPALDPNSVSYNPGCFFNFLVIGNKRVLHLIECVGAFPVTKDLVFRHIQRQTTVVDLSATLGGKPWSGPLELDLAGPSTPIHVSGIPQKLTYLPVGDYSITNLVLGGTPRSANISPAATQTIGPQNLVLTFRIDLPPPQIAVMPTSAALGLGTQFLVSGSGFSPSSTVTQNITLPNYTNTAPPPSAVTNSNGSYTFSIPANLLTLTGTYRLEAKDDSSGATSNFVTWTVTASATLPPPTTIYPGSPAGPGNTISMTTPTFLWMPVSGATGYKLYISKYPYGFVNLITPPTGIDIPGGASFSYTLQQGLLSNGGLYRWDMTTVSPAGEGSPASDLYFQVAPAPVVNDFSLTVAPTGQSVTQGNSAAYSIGTTITAGASQNIVLQVSGLPSGASSTFSPSSIPSGSSASLTVSTTASTPSGTYPLLIQATGSSVTHTQQINLSVSGATPGVPNLSITPPFWNFGNQTVGTGSQAQTFTLSNTGNAALSISSLVVNPQNEFFPAFLNAGLPLTIAVGTSVTLQVTFVPQAAGFRTGQIQLYTNTPNGIYTIVLNGTGVAAQPTTGNIQINATFNGQPWSGFVIYQLDGPQQYRPGTAPYTIFNVVPGDYTITYLSGGPGQASLVPISPATQTLAAGSTVTYTLNFTGTNDFSISWYSANTLGIRAGGTAQYTVQAGYIKGATQNITLDVAGLPGGASFSASPNPVPTQNKAALSISTSVTTPPGIHSFAVSGTNADGLTKQLQGTLVVTNPPPTPIERVSVSSNGTEGNGASLSRNGISQDGRYVVFDSQADNLVPGSGSTNGRPDIFVRDRQNGQTIWASQAFDGSQANAGSYSPAISADGRFVVFHSNAGNLVGPGQVTSDNHVFLHDLLMNVTTQLDVGSNGTPADKGSCCASISADGRFVVFDSSATNLGAGSTNASRHVYLRDRLLQKTLLVSMATDGSPGDQAGFLPVVSADGRFVAFVSNSTNLVPNDTNGFEDLFVRDMQTLVTVRANVATDGTQSNRAVWSQDQPTIGADGRFVAFMSNASNLAPEATDQSVINVFLRDLLKGETSVVSLSNDGTNTGTGGTFPVVSADGRFIVFGSTGWKQVRDRIANRTTVLDVASDGSLSNGGSSLPAMTPDGRSIAFLSIASNLVSNDTNNVADTFVAANTWVGSPSISSFALDMTSATGGATPTATLMLSTAPANDAVIELQSNNAAVQMPPTVTVAAGSSSVQFSVATLCVASEVTAVIVASYNGSSPIALLTLTPPTPSSIVVTGGDGQAATLGAAFGTALQVSVLDNLNNPVAGAQVTFMAPSSGASGTFSNGTDIATTTTDANGLALAPAFTAKNTPGGYTVTATVVGIATPAFFNLTNLNPTPSITPLPGSAVANAGGFTLPVTGSNFVSGSMVRWNGQDKPTTFVSSTQLNADISASDVSAVGNAQVTVFNPGPGGGLSNPWQFPILPPPVVAVSMNPGTVFAGQFSTGTVTLQFPAPSGGVPVSLTSSDPSVVVPASVAVQAGSLTATFPITTSLVNAQIVAVITATLNGTAQANFVVDPVLIAVGSLSAPSITILQGGASPAITVNITRTNFTGNVTLALSQLPSSVTATITDPGAGNSGTITLQATSAAAVASNQTITITASGTGIAPASATFDLTISPVSIAVSSVSVPSLTLLQGATTPAIIVNLVRTNFSGNVTLTLSPLPGGVAATITNPGPGNSGSIVLQATSGAAVISGQVITITASASGISPATATFTLTVDQVSIAVTSLSASSITVVQGTSSSPLTVSLQRTNFSGSVSLALSPLPSGVTASITDPGTGNSGSVVLQAASNAAVVSNQTITVTASGTGLSPASVTLSLTVTTPPSVSLSSSSLSFGNQPEGTTSATQTLTLTNGGGSALLITSIAIAGANGGEFAQTNNCGSSVAAAANCAVSITFIPSVFGSKTATLAITDSAAGSPHTASLTGTGTASRASLSTTGLTFSSQVVGGTSAAQSITLTNGGNIALAIASITVTGANGSDFSKTDNCGSSVPAGTNCTLNVTFAPTTAGLRTGKLNVTSNAAGSPHTVDLSGTGFDLSVTPQQGSSLSKTIPAGQPAIFNLSFAPISGLTSPVPASLACAVPANMQAANCTISPGSVNLGPAAANFTVTVTTTKPSLLLPRIDQPPQWPLWFYVLCAAWMTALASAVCLKPRPVRKHVLPVLAPAAAMIVLAILLVGCGGGGGGSGPPPPLPQQFTAPGTYTVTVTATVQGVPRTTNLTVVVQ